MKKIFITLIALSMLFCVPVFSYAAEEDHIEKANSIEEISEKAGAADGEAYITVELKNESVELASEDLTTEVNTVMESDMPDSRKISEISDIIEESGLYTVESESKKSIDVRSIFANKRLRLNAGYTDDLMTYGAENAVYYEDHYVLTYASEEETKAAYDKLAADHGAENVIIDYPVRLSAYGWGTEYMGMDKEQLTAAEGGDVLVAVIDSGINRSHEIFEGTTIEQGYDFVNGDDDPSDDNSHGTAVAGIIAESTGENVRILPVKVMGQNGEGSFLNIIYGLEYAVSHNADIINLSLGAYADSDSEYSQMKKLFEDALADSDAAVVCASGNDGLDMDGSNVYEFPGELSSTICVGAFAKSGSISSFSNYGSSVDFAAPGQAVKTAGSDSDTSYVSMSGTSFSSPYVAAAASLIKAEDPGAGSSDIKEALTGKAVDMGEEGRDDYFGNGCPAFTDDENTGSTQEPEEPEAGAVDISETDLIITGLEDKTYTGSEITQDIEVLIGETILTENTDYTLSYENNIDAGVATLVVTGHDAYTGSKAFTFTINPREITPSVSLDRYTYKYDGTIKTPAVTVKNGSSVLTEGKDYEVAYSEGRKSVGTYSVEITLIGNYRGSVRAEFRITEADSNINMTLSSYTYTYDGTAKKPAVTMLYNGRKLTEDTDYILSYSGGRTNAGTYEVTATLQGDYTGSVTEEFVISPKSISPSVSFANAAFTYDGKEKNPVPTVKDGTKTISSDNFELSYPAGRINAGTYTVEVSLKGNYSGSGRATFAIYKANNNITASGRTVKLSCKKLKKKAQKISAAKAMSISGAQGSVSYYLTGVNKSRASKYFSINRSTGKITVRKKIKKGTYTLTVNIAASGDSNHSPGTRAVKIKIKVK